MRRPRSTAPKQQEHQWVITMIRQRGKFLGYVAAPGRETAIQEAIKAFRSRIQNSRDG
jgi:hypothetical protein